MHNKWFNIHVRIILGSSASEEAEGQKEIEYAGNIKTDPKETAYEVAFTGFREQFCEQLFWIR